MATVVSSEVYDNRLVSLFQPGGDANDYGQGVQRQIYQRAVLTCPTGPIRIGHEKPVGWSGPGHLKRSHVNRGVLWRGNPPLYCEGTIAVMASYALYVHNGHAPITRLNRNGKAGLKIPASSYYRYRAAQSGDREGAAYVWRKQVDGYGGNPWLQDAADAVVALTRA